jgi:hypothetical protein
MSGHPSRDEPGDLGDECIVDDDFEEEAPARATLQAAIAWIATRSPELTHALQEIKLEKMEVLIATAGLVPFISIADSWTMLRTAIERSEVKSWGQRFEMGPDFEVGDVWPRGTQSRYLRPPLPGCV